MLVASGVLLLPHPSNCWGESLGDSSRDGVQYFCTVTLLYSVQSCTPVYTGTPQPHTLTNLTNLLS